MSQRSSSSPRKRKREVSADPSHRLHGTINPLSHGPGTLKQLALAGLSGAAELPSLFVPGFPHRAASVTDGGAYGEDSAEAEGFATTSQDEGHDADSRRSVKDSSGTETDGMTSAGSRRHRKSHRKQVRAAERSLGLLVGVTRRSLEEGNIPRARRAFGLLVRSRERGSPVDLRQHGYWALGAEILFREGEVKKPRVNGDETTTSSTLRRWGAAANITQVKAYYESLIQQYPYNRLWPRATSALDFWPAMVGMEFYNVHVEHGLALRALEEAAVGWEEEDAEDDEAEEEGDDSMEADHEAASQEDHHEPNHPRLRGKQRRLRDEKDKLRLGALEAMRDVARRMDRVMEDPPYNASHEMLRLRGMVALYMGDLAVPSAPGPRPAVDEAAGRAQRQQEQERAREKFEAIIKDGGEVDGWIELFVYPERREEERLQGGAVYASLPIRQSSAVT